MLEVENLVRHFVVRRSLVGRAVATVKAVDGVSFSVAAGETLALVGESGCGKSTVSRLVLRLIEPTAGSVRFEGRDVLALDAAGLRDFRREAQLVFQDPYGSLNPRMTVGDILAEPLLLHSGLPSARRAARVRELLDMVGLAPAATRRYPHEFTGGQRQRVAIARALAVEPRLVNCDEPVSALDVSIRSQILNLLMQLQQALKLSYLFISHDLSVVRHIADEAVVMYLGTVVERGPADALFAAARHPYTQALLSAIPLPDPAAQRGRPKIILSGDVPSPLAPPAGCPFVSRCPIRIERCAASRPTLAATGAGTEVACFVNGAGAARVIPGEP